jgi:branched-chain amino acid transport system substrate-binding protein
MTVLQRHVLTDRKTILHLSYERNTLAVAELLMAKNPPKAVVMIGAYAP